MTRRRKLVLAAGMLGATMLTSGAWGQSYTLFFQRPVGESATCYASGPATGSMPNVQGDAILDSAEYASGEKHVLFCKPIDLFGLEYTGDPSRFKVRGGDEITVGEPGGFEVGEADGNSADVTGIDRLVFEGLMLSAFSNDNLNHYVDLGGSDPRFVFTVEFEMMVMDDDPAPDDFGELLYFERGAGAGNSWLKLQAVDEEGTALGPWLVIGPDETVQTTPATTVYEVDQEMGTTSIDVSRLGVTEFKYLRVSNDVLDESAYTGGGDLAPDFKLMAVITNTTQLGAMVMLD